MARVRRFQRGVRAAAAVGSGAAAVGSGAVAAAGGSSAVIDLTESTDDEAGGVNEQRANDGRASTGARSVQPQTADGPDIAVQPATGSSGRSGHVDAKQQTNPGMVLQVETPCFSLSLRTDGGAAGSAAKKVGSSTKEERAARFAPDSRNCLIFQRTNKEREATVMHGILRCEKLEGVIDNAYADLDMGFPYKLENRWGDKVVGGEDTMDSLGIPSGATIRVVKLGLLDAEKADLTDTSCEEDEGHEDDSKPPKAALGKRPVDEGQPFTSVKKKGYQHCDKCGGYHHHTQMQKCSGVEPRVGGGLLGVVGSVEKKPQYVSPAKTMVGSSFQVSSLPVARAGYDPLYQQDSEVGGASSVAVKPNDSAYTAVVGVACKSLENAEDALRDAQLHYFRTRMKVGPVYFCLCLIHVRWTDLVDVMAGLHEQSARMAQEVGVCRTR